MMVSMRPIKAFIFAAFFGDMLNFSGSAIAIIFLLQDS